MPKVVYFDLGNGGVAGVRRLLAPDALEHTEEGGHLSLDMIFQGSPSKAWLLSGPFFGKATKPNTS